MIKRATIHSQSSMINLINALAVQIEQRDIDSGRIKTALKSANVWCILRNMG